MKKKLKILLLILLLSFTIANPIIVEAINSLDNNQIKLHEKYSNKDYVIDKYDIKIKVNENNTFDIIENITAYFNSEKHGIFRTIPLKNNLVRLNGTKSNNKAQVTNLSVNERYLKYKESGDLKVKIGSPDYTIIGEKKYTIKYTYNIGKDPLKDIDELYYNIIGNEWDTYIGDITFTIEMPKKFDKNKLGFSYGRKGSTESDAIKYSVENNIIKGSLDGYLNEKEGLTVRCELEEGYFKNAGFTYNYFDYLIYYVPIILFIISYLIWLKYGKDEQVIETVEFYPPDGLNSLEIGFLYEGKAHYKDVISLLIYLANRGYIKIYDDEKDFIIEKGKEYDGNDPNEKIFLEDLFNSKKIDVDSKRIKELRKEAKEKGKKLSYMDAYKIAYDEEKERIEEKEIQITKSDLQDNFYITLNTIKNKINKKENINRVFEKNMTVKKIVIYLLITIANISMLILPALDYGEPGIIFVNLFITFLIYGMFSFIINDISGNNIIIGWICLMWVCLMWFPFVFAYIKEDMLYTVGYFLGVVCILGMIICVKYLPKRTKYGNDIYGRILGFKNYLLTAEKDKLEMLVSEDPSYFYNILPYAYVLDVTDKWIKKFETISLKQPSWYYSDNKFNIDRFSSFMDKTMDNIESSMSSSPSDSGGSSGGGSSGGGSGGGGGGSW